MPHLDSSPEQLKDSARRLAEEVVNQGDVAAAAELIVPGHRDFAHGSQGVAGLAHRLRMLRRAFPDFHVIVEEQIVEGVWVAQRVSARGTHDGEFLGLAPSGQTAVFDLIELYRAGRDGRFAECRSSLGLLDVFAQLGPAPIRTPDINRKDR